MRRALAVGVLMLSAATGAAQTRPAAAAGSNEAIRRQQEYFDKLRESKNRPAKKAGPTASKPGLSPKELQDIRDDVIGARAVVRYLVRVEGLSKDEGAYVEEYVNGVGKVPPAVAAKVDPDKLKKWMAREEVLEWVVAETTYQNALRR